MVPGPRAGPGPAGPGRIGRAVVETGRPGAQEPEHLGGRPGPLGVVARAQRHVVASGGRGVEPAGEPVGEHLEVGSVGQMQEPVRGRCLQLPAAGGEVRRVGRRDDPGRGRQGQVADHLLHRHAQHRGLDGR